MSISAADVKALRDRTGAGDDGLQGRAGRGRRRHRQGGRDPARQGPGLGGQARAAAGPPRASSPPTSTPTTRSGRWSRSSARPTSSPATRTSRSSPTRSPCTSRPPRPRYVSADEIPEEEREAERRVFEAEGARGRQARRTSSRRSSRGSSRKWLEEVALLDQAHVNAENARREDDRGAARRSSPPRPARTSSSPASPTSASANEGSTHSVSPG